MTSATEELRRLLDERGVEWWNEFAAMHRSNYTHFEPDGGMFVDVWEQDGKLGIEAHTDYRFTPEQAIAATLGRGECQDLGGTGANDEQVFNCSECGCVLSLYDRDGSNNLCTSFIFDYPRYCPECGRKVVDA